MMYAMLNIPSHKSCQNCGECCGVIPANEKEIAEIRKYLENRPMLRTVAIHQSGQIMCPFRNEKLQRCEIYPVRPMICRLFGVAAGANCPHGNSTEIDGQQFLAEHGLERCVLLNDQDWNEGKDYE